MREDYLDTMYYLYNFDKIDKFIREEKEKLEYEFEFNDRLAIFNRNSKNERVKKNVKDLEKIKELIIFYLNICKDRDPLEYRFIRLKFFEKMDENQIFKELRINSEKQEDITRVVVFFFCNQFKKAGVI